MLALMTVTSVVMFSAGFAGGATLARGILVVVPAALASLAGRPAAALGYLAITGLTFAAEFAGLGSGPGGWLLLPSGLASVVCRIGPGLFLGYLAVSTIKVSELMAALEAWRAPRQLVIPMVVVLRFAPTARASVADVGRAMTARGLTLTRIGPVAWLESRLVPLIISTVKAGEELSQAALTRGLGRPGRPTRIARVGFGWLDFLVAIAMTAAVAVWLTLP
jgi:energy-coupling factor transport system permease protein